MRPEIHSPPMTAAAAEKVAHYHAETVEKVRAAIARHEVLVVGMAWNTPARKVCRALDTAGVKYEYLELGNYLGMWRKRLAVKLWTGWPTFPQVFIKGTFIGGADLTITALADGSFHQLLGSAPAAGVFVGGSAV